MTTSEPILSGRWATRLVILLLLLCGFYGSYRAVHLAITDDEVSLLDCVHGQSYVRLLFAADWDFKGFANVVPHFLNVLLAKPCVDLLPLNEITASRLPSLLGLVLFLWGVWRMGLHFPSGATRVLITLALLSNAFLLDFFGLSRGYGIAVGFTVLSLSFLMQVSMVTTTGDGPARRQIATSLWLAFGAALSSMPFLHVYVALLLVTLWLDWRNRLGMHRIHKWAGGLLLAVLYAPRVIVSGHPDYFGGDVGFVHDTVGSLVHSSFYDRPVSAGLVQLVSAVFALLMPLLAYRSHRERIHAAFALSMVNISAAASCMIANHLWGVRYPVERTALYFVPLVILIIGTVAASSRLRWLRLFLWGTVLAFTGIGLQGANLGHTLGWRQCADIPSALVALQKVRQQTGQDVMVAIDPRMWTLRYYAEHLLGLQVCPVASKSDISYPYLQTYDWLTVYEWKLSQTHYSLPPDNPLVPGTTHVLLSLLNRDDGRLLATPPVGGLTQLRFYPASDTILEALIKPQHQGTMTFPDGGKYVGEFKHGLKNGRGTYIWPNEDKYEGDFKNDKPNGRGTYTWPDGRKYVGEYRDGLPNGRGAYTWPDGTKYEGESRNGKPNGRGIYTWPDGRRYIGEYKGGLPNGRGTYTWPDGTKYEGELRDGTPNGQGTGTQPNGQKYVGEFRDGQPDGTGQMTYPDGRVENGLWKQGQFAGPAPH